MLLENQNNIQNIVANGAKTYYLIMWSTSTGIIYCALVIRLPEGSCHYYGISYKCKTGFFLPKTPFYELPVFDVVCKQDQNMVFNKQIQLCCIFDLIERQQKLSIFKRTSLKFMMKFWAIMTKLITISSSSSQPSFVSNLVKYIENLLSNIQNSMCV